MEVREFKWLPNIDEADSRVQYDFIELPLFHFENVTFPGELNFNKMDANEKRLSQNLEVYMPIIHFKPNRDPENRLEYFQGRHRTSAASKFSNAESKIVVMIPRENVEEIVEALDCEITAQTFNEYSNHDGILYYLKVKEFI